MTKHIAATLRDVFMDITRCQQPGYWYHDCQKKNGETVRLKCHHICPDCYVDQYGSDHNKPGGAQ